ncbi:hypothetical protein [Limosilactobacillus fermentum]|uniref:hypothetical protein n=1 Tax=Limosilactobacillus fermentum TaxID=1613 RepID=UPI0021659E5D|nr:hypothetical protein [Limosilactobacillus fermentum]UVW03814.1 hypothetical protein NX839_01595 [Limosilactobacillus fermentum]WEN06282.1 hypothetical protein P0M30_04335 [Limosilactobacillus fermentum]WEN13137.1 hypothetical protein P0N62_04340 [Limosilactobacillus fermentum]WJD39791.1 hypothetical protein QRA02_04340 [Limosilactobacillus fermentum]
MKNSTLKIKLLPAWQQTQKQLVRHDMINDRTIKSLLVDGPLTTLGEDLVERLFMVAPKEELLERSLKLTLLDDDRPGAPAFTPPFHFQHNAKALYLWWPCHRDHNCLRAVAVRGTLNLLQKVRGPVWALPASIHDR